MQGDDLALHQKEIPPMYNITIGRFDEDPEAQGVVRAADGSWQVVVDKDGFPHLYVRVKLEDPGQDESGEGLFCVEDVMPDDLKIRDLMQGAFGGKLSPEEEAAAAEEVRAERERYPVPCPR